MPPRCARRGGGRRCGCCSARTVCCATSPRRRPRRGGIRVSGTCVTLGSVFTAAGCTAPRRRRRRLAADGVRNGSGTCVSLQRRRPGRVYPGCRRGCVTPLWNDCPPQRATGPRLGGRGSAAALVPRSLQFGNGDGIKGVVYSVFTAGNSILNDVILRCWDALFWLFSRGGFTGVFRGL